VVLITRDRDGLGSYKLELKHFVYSTIATEINVKRALRRQVEGKIDTLFQDIAALKRQVDRIERKIEEGQMTQQRPI
jgi:hypothetical protein